MFDRLGGANIFSTLYFKQGVHQIRVKTEDIEKLRSRLNTEI